MLRITASLTEGMPVDLRDVITGIDSRNVRLLIAAIRHASGTRPEDSGPTARRP
jgi:hypothetical protein